MISFNEYFNEGIGFKSSDPNNPESGEHGVAIAASMIASDMAKSDLDITRSTWEMKDFKQKIRQYMGN